MASTAELIRRRDEVMVRANAALDADWPGRKSEEFIRVTQWAIGELKAIAEVMASVRVGRTERARTLRHLAGLHSDLGPALGPQQLLDAERLYRDAERLLEGEADAAESAKLDYNLANILRQIDHNDIDRLKEALERVRRARMYFAAHESENVGQCDAVLQSTEGLLRLAPLAIDVKRREKEAAEIVQSLKAGGDIGAIAKKAEELLKSGGGAPGMLSQIQAVVDMLPEETKTDPRYQTVLGQLAGVTAKAVGPAKPSQQGAQILAAIEERFNRELAAGTVSATHKPALEDAIKQISKMLGRGDKSIDELTVDAPGDRDFIAGWIENAHYASFGVERPTAPSRAAELVEMNWLLRRHLLKSMNRPGRGDEESREAMELSTRASTVDRRIYEAGRDDAVARVVECESLRPLAIAVRQFSAREYMMPAMPIWGGNALPVDITSLFHSGAPGTEALMEVACQRAGLRLPSRATGDAYARMRWHQLQQALVTVFDLRAGTEAERCEVCYELGVALVLGRPIVVVVAPGQVLPFDIDIDAVELSRGAGPDEQTVAEAIDRAVCWTYPEADGRSWRATLDHVLAERAANAGNVYVDQTVQMLRKEPALNDPTAAHRTLEMLLSYLRDGHTLLLHPRWPPAYPARGEVRLFHVMPFRPRWAPQVTAVVRAACEANDALYVRGDEVNQPDVIRSIWEQIARASHVLVDLTGFNANVALELGIAHTLGRPVLMVGQDDTADCLFPSVGKLRLYPYRLRKLDRTLGSTVRSFLAA